MTYFKYDPLALLHRARQLRADAATAATAALRGTYLAEAEDCDSRAERSLRTPILRDELASWFGVKVTVAPNLDATACLPPATEAQSQPGESDV